MERITFSTGMKEFEINGQTIRFNPNDLNLFTRFMEAGDQIKAIEKELVERARSLQEEAPESIGSATIKLMSEADRKIKDILAWIFGSHNDFDKIFGGENVMSVAENGERNLTNFIMALSPVLTQGAKIAAKQQAKVAAAQIKLNRAGRRAQK